MSKIFSLSAIALLLPALTGCYAYYPPEPAPAYLYSYPAPPLAPVGGNGGPECREYTKSAQIDNKHQTVTGTACLQPDGSWRDQSDNAQVAMPAPPPPPAPAYAPPPPYYAPAPAYYPAYPAPYAYPPAYVGGEVVIGGGGYRHWR